MLNADRYCETDADRIRRLCDEMVSAETYVLRINRLYVRPASPRPRRTAPRILWRFASFAYCAVRHLVFWFLSSFGFRHSDLTPRADR